MGTSVSFCQRRRCRRRRRRRPRAPRGVKVTTHWHRLRSSSFAVAADPAIRQQAPLAGDQGDVRGASHGAIRGEHLRFEPVPRGFHSSTSQLNLSRFITDTIHCILQKVLTLSRKLYECKPLPVPERRRAETLCVVARIHGHFQRHRGAVHIQLAVAILRVLHETLRRLNLSNIEV
jgi:hypothetical protein